MDQMHAVRSSDAVANRVESGDTSTARTQWLECAFALITFSSVLAFDTTITPRFAVAVQFPSFDVLVPQIVGPVLIGVPTSRPS